MLGTPLLLTIALTATGMHRCVGSYGFIYDQVGENRAEVFNLRSGMMYIQSKSDAAIGRSTEFGGPVQYCNSSSFHCLSAPMTFYNLIVPKAEAEGSWSFHGSNCRTQASGAGRLVGQCENGLSYLYERGRGITRYSWAYRGHENTFALRGECGLFSER